MEWLEGTILTTLDLYGLQSLKSLGLYGGIISIALGVIPSLLQWLNVSKEPAESSLDDYVDLPDYNANLGVIHHIEKDLKRVFQIVGNIKPLVIFIDDLDRCTPGNVANVMEAINLFLAGEIPNCIFIMGMDPGIVAAALEYKHKEVMANIPSYSTSVPIGWRFMDKFVQLPIVVRPPTRSYVDKYIGGLLLKQTTQIARQIHERTSSNAIRNNNRQTNEKKEIVEEAQKEELSRSIMVMPTLPFLSSNTSSNRLEPLRNNNRQTNEKKEIVEEAQNGIEELSDQDKEFQDQTIRATYEYSQNPRDLKRFINSLRYHRYLNETMLAAAKTTSTEYFEPSSQQISDWIILSLKWPEVIRWIYWNPDVNTPRERLESLEEIASSCDNEKDCEKEAEDKLHLQAKDVHWISDIELWKFFSKRKEYMRLSIPAGRSFY